MEYKKNKEFLLCVDSDGCVMDVMDIKHKECFGPVIFNHFDIEKDTIDIWIEINLHSPDRGINRFKGLELFFIKLKEKEILKEDFSDLSDWINQTNEFSEKSLENFMKDKDSKFLKKVLEWSKEVNIKIKNLEEKRLLPYKNAITAIKKAYENFDIAVVSSANPTALKDEWSRHGLIEYTTICMAQDFGTKADCIKLLLEQGYDKNKVLMVGDAIGDLKAARVNEVSFYPIIAYREEESWEKFISVLDEFLNGKYQKIEKDMEKDFIAELSGN